MSQKRSTILNEFKLRMTTKPLAQGAKPPALVVNVYRNNPQITVFTGHDNGSGITMLSAGMDVDMFSTLIEWVRHYTMPDTPPGKIKVENKKPVPKEERTDPKQRLKVSTETWVGKDEDGKLWISIVSAENPSAPKIQFYFGQNYYHTVRTKEPESMNSSMAARGWCNTFTHLVFGVLVALGQDEQNTGGGKSGGSSNGGNSSWNNNSNSNKGKNNSWNTNNSNKSTSSMDDDDDVFDDDY